MSLTYTYYDKNMAKYWALRDATFNLKISERDNLKPLSVPLRELHLKPISNISLDTACYLFIKQAFVINFIKVLLEI